MRSGYRPESDISRLLDEEHIGWYQGLIGTLRWLIEVGQIDITHSVTLLSSYLSSQREGHLFEAFHIFAYLKRNMNLSLILDPESIPFHQNPSCTKHDWDDFYPGAKEAIPPNAPSPRGYAVSTAFYVDADHAGDTTNRRSHSGILGYVQGAPVLWYSKRQATVETSTHGAKLVATRIAVELIESLRYKLYMFGVPIDGPTILLCDNQSVVHNGTKPDSVLKKKHNSISYHKIRESVAAGFVELHKVATEDNLADILTKVLSGVARFCHQPNHYITSCPKARKYGTLNTSKDSNASLNATLNAHATTLLGKPTSEPKKYLPDGVAFLGLIIDDKIYISSRLSLS